MTAATMTAEMITAATTTDHQLGLLIRS